MNNCTNTKVEDYEIAILSMDFDKEVNEYWIEKDSTVIIEKGVYSIFVTIAD